MRWAWSAFSELSAPEVYDVLRLRQDVFVVEQACAYPDADGLDAGAVHLLGLDEAGLCAYLRAFGPGAVGADASIGRVVVAPRARGTGLGTALMREGMARVASTWGDVPIRISAQSHLEAWYTRLGFAVIGAGYLEDGIPHLPMRLSPSAS